MSRLPGVKGSRRQQRLTLAAARTGQTTRPGPGEDPAPRHSLLGLVSAPELKLRRVCPADVQKQRCKEKVPPEQHEWSPNLDQEDPVTPHIKEEWSPSLDQEDPVPPHIKEEQEELWTSVEEADITKFPFTPVPVKSEEGDEEKPQSSQLHQSQTEQMETEANGEDCGGPEPARNSDPDTYLQPVSDDRTSDSSETDDSDKNWNDPDRKSFSCSVCGKTFKHRGNVNIHMRTHTGVKPFSCSVCGKRFTQKASLNYHVRTHTGERPFSCSVCSKTFRHKGALTYHMATHTGVKPFSCTDCGKTFRGTSQLKVHKCLGDLSQLHQSKSDKRKKPLNCSECDVTFPNNYLLTTHMRMHKGKKLFTCTVCGQKRQFSSHLEIHMRTHTGEKPYSCSFCGKRFSQRGIMTQHMAVHSGVKPYGCSDCGRRFFWQFQIKKHKCLGKSLQQRRTGFNGKDCGGSELDRNSDPDRLLQPGADENTKSFETDDSVDIEFWKETRQHQSGFTYRRTKKVSGKTDSKADDSVSSDFCKQTRHLNLPKKLEASVSNKGYNTDRKSFSSSESQKRSEDSRTLQTLRKCQTGGKAFSCVFCGKGFATGGYLTRHISLHTGEKLRNCIVCEKRFPLNTDIISHTCGGESLQLYQSQTEEQVTANTLLSCSQYRKGFGHKHQLQVHMRCYTGEKPFCCSVCNTGFSDSESLVKHMRIHTGQTQFSCSICGKEFAWRRCLTKHMEIHAKKKMYSCRVCDKSFTRIYQLNYHECVESSQLHQSQTEQMETGADGEDCGGPEQARDSDPDRQPETEDTSETEDSDGDWEETRGTQSGLNSLSDKTCDAGGKRFSCSECGETFYNNRLLNIHVKNHTGEHKGANQEDPPEPPHIKDKWSPSLDQEDPETPHNKEEWSPSLDQKDPLEPPHIKEKWFLSLDQEDPPEHPHIKEEQEELWISQEGEQLPGLEEADITNFTFTPVPVKSEEDDDEEKPQSSQLHQSQTEQMEADGEDCDSDPDRLLQPETEDKPEHTYKTEDSVDSDFWKETRERCSDEKASESVGPETDDSVDSDFWKDNRKPQLDLNSLKNNEVSESETMPNTLRKTYSCSECGKRFLHICNMNNHMKFHTGEKAFFCSVCGQKCLYKSHLKIHMRTHTGEKPFSCPVCGKKYAHKASMQSHMVVHTVEKQYTCDVCDKSFAWYTELKYHQCVGESSHENPCWGETT
ncbi:oocyte zinc finger protein XlCOF7.1-like isoform X1 [Micropterus dolomieu]|uniref:oocyte zinc finger protein XlCOF7.1-like isoform X1 n=1 Tax=Micropterus dolomieu TaxID=147949 RepID=UPI001E8CC127|nr:oocyte zinc finger protein XlCOF7.1-like isoform X1 [Micropterus dolomieu]